MGLRGGDAGAQQGGFAHAPRAPQQHVVRSGPGCQPQDIAHHRGLLRINAADQIKRRRLQHGHRARGRALPKIGGVRQPVDGGRRGRGQAIQRIGNAPQNPILIGHDPGSAHQRGGIEIIEQRRAGHRRRAQPTRLGRDRAIEKPGN